jgi:hypothetical protein
MRLPHRACSLLLAPLLAAGLLFPLPVAAQEGQPAAGKPAEGPARAAVSLLPLLLSRVEPSATEDAATFGEALRSGLGRNLAAAGYSVLDETDALSPDAPEPAAAGARAAKAGATWAAVCELGLEEGRIAYRVAVYDAEDGSLAGGDAFSALSGLSAIPLMNDATARVVQGLAAYESAKAGLPRRLVDYRVVVRCPVEGALVSLDSPGAPSGTPLGKIRNGQLELPYYPFILGSTIHVSATAPAMSRTRAEAVLGAEAAVVELRPSSPPVDLLLSTGSGHLLGAGGTYRAYLDPDWTFLFYEDRIFAAYDFAKGSTPVLHNELWSGFGWYLFFPPSSRFRMGYSLGWGALFSFLNAPGLENHVFLDLALLPADIFFEYTLGKKMAAWISLSTAFSVGTGETGLLGRDWMAGQAPIVSAGLLWRRR